MSLRKRRTKRPSTMVDAPRMARPARQLAVALVMTPFLALVGGLVSSAGAQQTGRGSSHDVVRGEVSVIPPQSDTTVALGASGLVNVTIRSGSLLIRGTDRTSAEIRTEGTAYEVRSSGVGIALLPTARTSSIIDRSYNRSSLRSDDRASERRPARTRMELSVPRGVRVIIAGTSGDIELDDIAGDVEIRSSSGDISLSRLGGRAIVETLTGDVSVRSGVSDLRVITTSGDVEAGEVRGAADVRTTSGSIQIDAARASRVAVQTISGDLVITGTVTADARLTLVTHSGDVDLGLASGTRGSLEFQTFNGELSATGPLLLTPPGLVSGTGNVRSTQRFEFGGGGGVLITVTSFSGDVQFNVPDRR